MGQRFDVLAVLKQEREYYLGQVRKIDIAISALEGEPPAAKTKRSEARPNRWAQAIDDIFAKTNEWLTFQEIRQKMADNGMPEALEKPYRNSIYTTLHRKAKKSKVLEKDDNGRFRTRKEA